MRLEAKLNFGHQMLPWQFGFVRLRLGERDCATRFSDDDVARCSICVVRQMMANF